MQNPFSKTADAKPTQYETIKNPKVKKKEPKRGKEKEKGPIQGRTKQQKKPVFCPQRRMTHGKSPFVNYQLRTRRSRTKKGRQRRDKQRELQDRSKPKLRTVPGGYLFQQSQKKYEESKGKVKNESGTKQSEVGLTHDRSAKFVMNTTSGQQDAHKSPGRLEQIL